MLDLKKQVIKTNDKKQAKKLLNKIIGRIKKELRNPDGWKQITIEEWIKMLEEIARTKSPGD